MNTGFSRLRRYTAVFTTSFETDPRHAVLRSSSALRSFSNVAHASSPVLRALASKSGELHTTLDAIPSLHTFTESEKLIRDSGT